MQFFTISSELVQAIRQIQCPDVFSLVGQRLSDIESRRGVSTQNIYTVVRRCFVKVARDAEYYAIAMLDKLVCPPFRLFIDCAGIV